jgi:tight adherence protein B
MDAATGMVALISSVSVGALALAGTLGYIAWNREQTLLHRLQTFVAPYIEAPEATSMDSRFERALRRTPIGMAILRDMTQLGLDIRPGRLLVYGFTVAGGAFVVANVYKGSNTAGVLAAVSTLGAEYMLMHWRAGKRWTVFRLQLPEALHVVASALSAGASLNQALEHAAREVAPPLKGELTRVVEDVEVGKTLEEALESLKKRVPLPEFDTIIASLLIQQRSGGNLAQLLNETAEILKEDQRLRREMEVLTSQARASAQLIGLMPIGLFLFMYFFNPQYLEPMLTTGLGMTALSLGLVLEGIGFFVVYRIASYSEYAE